MNRIDGTHHHLPNGILAKSPSCPTCGSAISHQQYERILRISDARQKQLADAHARLERERENVGRERTEIASAAVAAARAQWQVKAARAAREIEVLRKQSTTEHARLVRAHERNLQTEIRRREAQQRQLVRKLAATQARVEVAVEARVRDVRRAVEEQQRAVIDGLRAQLKTTEQRRRRDEDAWKKTFADLQRKADVRNKEHFGPESEEDLVKTLRDQFPGDRIEHRGKGGGVLHIVLHAGRDAGRIVYEVKNTKGWDRSYLRQTQRAMETHGTRYGFLVSRALPARQTGMCVLAGVIVATPPIAAHVVAIVRDSIVALFRLHASEKDKTAKASALFEYLRGEEFTTAIQRVQVKVGELRDSLSRERSHHDGWWHTRANQYGAILREAAGIDARVTDLLGGRIATSRDATTPPTSVNAPSLRL